MGAHWEIVDDGRGGNSSLNNEYHCTRSSFKPPLMAMVSAFVAEAYLPRSSCPSSSVSIVKEPRVLRQVPALPPQRGHHRI